MLKPKFSCPLLAMSIISGVALAQQSPQHPGNVQLNDLSAFKDPAKSWSIAADVNADLKETNVLKFSKGTGILVNQPDKKNHGKDLFTNFQHGDIDLELDYMMAKGANSGIYLQGRYEIQLEDSWGTKNPTSANNGGIYERWDDSKPEGQKGYDGHAPRQNASRGPGLWQHLKVSFQAPRFDASGKKIENAKILRAELNGVPIHENVELQGPTRGAISNEEKALGPLRIQGDHGAVAFRNIEITNYDKARPELTALKYSVYKGKFDKEPDFTKTPPEAEGASPILTTNITGLNNEFLIRYTGKLVVKEPGRYTFSPVAAGGQGVLKINGKPVSAERGRGAAEVELPAGQADFELLYAKQSDWAKPAVGLVISGPGIREFIIGEENPGYSVDPILVEANTNTILRSFMDIPGMRVVHAVSVGSPEQVHYTYDMDKGALVQIWRGGFLDATPMWHDRGDGSSRPRGVVQRFGKPQLTLAKLSSTGSAWLSDTAGTGYRPKGYVLDANQQPTFKYNLYGATVNDAIRVMNNGEGITRQITIQNAPADLFIRLAEADNIEETGKGSYLVDGKSYYLNLDQSARASIRDINGRKELIAPVQGSLSYSILF